MIKKHIDWLIGCAAVLVIGLGFLSYQREHDARILAEQTVKESAARVSDLQAQAKATDEAGRKQLADIQKRAAAVRTPAQAIAAIPSVTDVPLNVRVAPALPDAVIVDAVPLFRELSQCRATAVELNTCRADAVISGKIAAEQTIQITALKQRKTFWKRFGGTARDVGIGLAVGYAVRRATR